MATILRRACSCITPVLVAMLVPLAQGAAPAASEPAAAPGTSSPAATPTAPAAPVASPRPSPRPSPRLLSPEEKRLSATEPGQLRPAQRPVPQVRIPLGPRAADGERPERPEGIKPLRRAPAPAASASGRIDDEAARCEAQSSAEAAKACRLLNSPGRKGRSS